MPATTYTEEQAQRIIDAIADGATLRAACRAEEIAASTFIGWCDIHPDLSEQYARAKSSQLDAWADQIITLGDGVLNEESGSKVTAANNAANHRKWLLSRLKPERYGDKIQHTGDGGGPVTYRWARNDEPHG